jgi:hypothetical protein
MSDDLACVWCQAPMGPTDHAGYARCESCGRQQLTPLSSGPEGAGPAGAPGPTGPTGAPSPSAPSWPPMAPSAPPMLPLGAPPAWYTAAQATSPEATGPPAPPVPIAPRRPARRGPEPWTIALVISVAVVLVAVLVVVLGSGDDQPETAAGPTTTLPKVISGGGGPGAGAPDEEVVGRPVTFPEAGGATGILAATWSESTSRAGLVRLAVAPDGTVEVRWRAIVAATSERPVAAVATDGRWVAAVAGRHVGVFDIRSGTPRSGALVSGEPDLRCGSCFVVVDDTLVMRLAGGSVVGFGLDLGPSRWTAKPESGVLEVQVAGDRIVVTEVGLAPTTEPSARSIDPGTGTSGPEAAVACGEGHAPAAMPTPMSPIDDDNSDLVAVGVAGGAACVVRWNPDDGSVRWSTEVPGAHPDLPVPSVQVVSRDTAVFSAGAVVAAVDLATGKVRLLDTPADTDVQVRGVIDGIVVADYRRPGGRAAETGPVEGGALGLDLASGSLAWETLLAEASTPAIVTEPFGDLRVRPADGRLSTLSVVHDEVVHVLSVRGTGPSVATRSLDPASGELGLDGPQLRSFDDEAAIALQPHGVPGATTFVVDGHLEIIRWAARGAPTVWPAS